MNRTQISVLLGSVVVVVLLLFANTRLPENKGEQEMSDHAGSNNTTSIVTLVNNAKAELDDENKIVFKKLEEALVASSDKTNALESLIKQWGIIRKPLVAAYYAEQLAIVSADESLWKMAGDRYYAATRFVKEAEKQTLFKKAMECFEKTLDLNPGNVDAKINLASCYVEGSPSPMKGIGMLKDIEKTDSTNVNLQLSFAFFSEKSGQWDKAIARFNKVLILQPSFIEAYLHLADAYDKKGETEKVIENLEEYIALVDDLSVKAEIRGYINKLKN